MLRQVRVPSGDHNYDGPLVFFHSRGQDPSAIGCTSLCANSTELPTFCSANIAAVLPRSFTPVCAAAACPSKVLTACWAAAMKSSKAFLAARRSVPPSAAFRQGSRISAYVPAPCQLPLHCQSWPARRLSAPAKLGSCTSLGSSQCREKDFLLGLLIVQFLTVYADGF